MARVGGWLGPLVLLAVLAAGCSIVGSEGSSNETTYDGCGPITLAETVGRAPAYARGYGSYPQDEAACRAVWLPGAGSGFVPQGLAVRRGTAWVSGYGDAAPGHRFCQVVRVDLSSGELLGELRLGPDGPLPACRHGGGVALDGDRLWLIENKALWALDVSSLQVLARYPIRDLKASVLVADSADRLGIGSFRRHRPGRLHWYSLPTLRALPSGTPLGPSDAIAVRRITRGAQGLAWTPSPRRGEGLWQTSSTSTCGLGVLPSGRRVGLLPGAEGLARDGDTLWVVSETASAPYQRLDRPSVPMLVGFETRHLDEWTSPACMPWE